MRLGLLQYIWYVAKQHTYLPRSFSRVQVPAAKPDEPVHAPVPDVEWWDARLLPGGSYGDASSSGGRFDVRADRITSLVEHPVLLEPPAEGPPPPPQPLKLTKKVCTRGGWCMGAQKFWGVAESGRCGCWVQ